MLLSTSSRTELLTPIGSQNEMRDWRMLKLLNPFSSSLDKICPVSKSSWFFFSRAENTALWKEPALEHLEVATADQAEQEAIRKLSEKFSGKPAQGGRKHVTGEPFEGSSPKQSNTASDRHLHRQWISKETFCHFSVRELASGLCGECVANVILCRKLFGLLKRTKGDWKKRGAIGVSAARERQDNLPSAMGLSHECAPAWAAGVDRRKLLQSLENITPIHRSCHRTAGVVTRQVQSVQSHHLSSLLGWKWHCASPSILV